MVYEHLGITKHLNYDIPAMVAVIKNSCEDFEVREINLDGSIAGLTQKTEIVLPSKKLKLDADIASSFCEIGCQSVQINNPKRESKLDTDDVADKTPSACKQDGSTVNPCLDVNSSTITNTSDSSTKERSIDHLRMGNNDDVTENKDAVKEMASENSKNVQSETVSRTDLSENINDIDSVTWMTSADEINEFLKEKLSENVLEKIKNFNENTDELQIGCFNDKSVRKLLHETIRYINPFIETKAVTDSDSYMSCCFQSNVKTWLPLFPNENILKDFLRFVNCRNLLQHLTCDMEFFNKELYEYRIPVEKFSREDRKSFHDNLQKNFGKLIMGRTIRENESAFISIRFRPKPLNKRQRKHKPGYVTQFVLHKENLEMLDALNMVSERLKVPLTKISYAGMKDKKAVTYQFITAIGVACHTIGYEAILSNARWTVSNPKEVNEMLQPGALRGNRFVICARNATLLDKDSLPASNGFNYIENIITNSVLKLQENGFINYFGKQRFGETGESAEIGLQLLKHKYEEVVQLILAPRLDLKSDANLSNKEKAKRYFTETRDFKGALKMMPKSNKRERCVLEGLQRFGVDEKGCQASFRRIPHHARMLYVHSYASLVWNKVVSRRLELDQTHVLKGDLVLHNGKPVTLSEHDIHQYTMHDIVLPLPGSAISYPDNDTKNMYKLLMENDGINEQHFESFRKLDGNIRGSYRKILVKPSNMEYKVLPCAEKNISAADVTLTFELPLSSYATMVTRELFHQD